MISRAIRFSFPDASIGMACPAFRVAAAFSVAPLPQPRPRAARRPPAASSTPPLRAPQWRQPARRARSPARLHASLSSASENAGDTVLVLSVEWPSVESLSQWLRDWLRAYVFGAGAVFPVPVSVTVTPSGGALLFYAADSAEVRGRLCISAAECIALDRVQVLVTSASTFARGGASSALPGERRLLRTLASALEIRSSGALRVVYKSRGVRLRAPASAKPDEGGPTLVVELSPPVNRKTVVDALHSWAVRRQFAGTSGAVVVQGAVAASPTSRGVAVEVRNSAGRLVATVDAEVRSRSSTRGDFVIVIVTASASTRRDVKRVVRR